MSYNSAIQTEAADLAALAERMAAAAPSRSYRRRMLREAAQHWTTAGRPDLAAAARAAAK